MKPPVTERVLGLLGLCARARKLVIGTALICTALSKGESKGTPVLVIEAADSSANTHKRITDRCTHYGVRAVRIEADCATLAHRIGKGDAAVAAVGVTDAQLARAILAALDVHND